MGAGGLRPLLGGRAEAGGGAGTATKEHDRAPTFRVPGASVAAKAAGGHSSNGSWAEVAGARAPGGAAAPPPGGATATRVAQPNAREDDDVDADGFRVVKGRKGRNSTAGDAGAEAGMQGGEQTARPADQGATRRGDDDDARDGTRDDADANHEPPTTADLRQRWQDEITLVKKLRGQGLPDHHPVMRAACTARDQAEQAWRGAKEPAPASVRLGRAQQRLDRAIALQADARRALWDAEAEHRARMSALQATMDECTERVRLRREQLGTVQAEVGAGSAQATGAGQAQQAAIRKVHEAISGEVGPAIAALVDQLDTSAPAWTTLNGVLGTLAMSKAALEGAVGQQDPKPTQYDIGDCADHDCDAMGDGDSEWSESHEVQAPQWGTGSAGSGWQGWGDEQQGAEDCDQSMGTGQWWDVPTRRWGEATRWRTCGHGQWTKASWADQLEEEQDDSRDSDGQPPVARRRLDAAGGDQATKDGQEQGQEQLQPQPQQQALQRTEVQQAASASAADSTEREDPGEARRRHQARINRITEMAVEAGVTPLTKGGEDLLVLDPAQLEAWVAECLPAALLV